MQNEDDAATFTGQPLFILCDDWHNTTMLG